MTFPPAILRPSCAARRAALGLAMLAGLAGCSTLAAPLTGLDLSIDTDSPGADLRPEVSQPVQVVRETRLIELPLDAVGGREFALRVRNLAFAYRADGVAPLRVGAPESAGSRAADAVTRAAEILAANGVPEADLELGTFDGAAFDRSGLVLYYDAPTARSLGCPRDWGDPTRDASNAQSARFGCARQVNLATMVARPRDLEGPRPSTPNLTTRRETVLDAYAKGDKTAAQAVSDSAETTK